MGFHFIDVDIPCPRCGEFMHEVSLKTPFTDDWELNCRNTACVDYEKGYRRLCLADAANARSEQEI